MEHRAEKDSIKDPTHSYRGLACGRVKQMGRLQPRFIRGFRNHREVYKNGQQAFEAWPPSQKGETETLLVRLNQFQSACLGYRTRPTEFLARKQQKSKVSCQ